jgi:hypothetical protein
MTMSVHTSRAVCHQQVAAEGKTTDDSIFGCGFFRIVRLGFHLFSRWVFASIYSQDIEMDVSAIIEAEAAKRSVSCNFDEYISLITFFAALP